MSALLLEKYFRQPTADSLIFKTFFLILFVRLFKKEIQTFPTKVKFI